MSERELARIGASAPRRAIGMGTLLGLGGLLLYIAFATPPASVGWLVFLVLCGAGSLWMGSAMWRATTLQIVLTDAGLFESTGVEIARIDQILRVERGAFAMKPSNGFMLVLAEPGPRAWRPGLWWRLGRRVAVGGVVPGSQARPVADIIAFKIAERTAG